MSEYKFYTYGFEKLEAWQSAMKLTRKIYEISSQFPSAEQFGLIMQMQRSVTSVGSNIAEGSARKSKKDRARFYQIAFSSLMETLNHVILAEQLTYVQEHDYLELRKQIDEVARLLNGLYRSQRSEMSEPSISYGSKLLDESFSPLDS